MQTETIKLSLIRQIMETNDTAEFKKKEQNYLPVDKRVLHQKIEELDLKTIAHGLNRGL